MFIDDTGNVDSAASNDPQRRYGGITGVIFEIEYLRDTFEPGLLKLKQRHFGLTDKGRPPILHLRQMKKGVGAFRVLVDLEKRKRWETACFAMYKKAQYHIITSAVDKIEFYHKHPQWQGSIYELLVGDAIERFFYFLRYKGTGDVVAEGVNKAFDSELKNLYRRFYDRGTEHINAARLQKVLSSKEIKIKPKQNDVQGLQMADLLASTCFAHCKRLYAGGPDFNEFAMKVAALIEEEKFYRDRNGDPHGYGRIWRPQN